MHSFLSFFSCLATLTLIFDLLFLNGICNFSCYAQTVYQIETLYAISLLSYKSKWNTLT